MRVGSLCSGYGGLEMGLESAFGEIDLRFVSDIDKNASKVLAHYHPTIPNLGDLITVDWEQQDQIDLLVAGYPCQPYSIAGLQKGSSDDRAIFRYIATAISVLRPKYIFLENVSNHLTVGGLSVIGTLTELRYDCRWGIIRASEAFAPHQRKRLFIWCETADSAPGRGFTTFTHAGSKRYGRGKDSRTMADSFGQVESEAQQQRTWEVSEHRSSKTFDWQQYETAIRRWEAVTGRLAPIPTIEGKVNEVFVEWMMGLPLGWLTNKELDLSRSAILKLLGNGVVPQQAHLALTVLLKEMGRN